MVFVDSLFATLAIGFPNLAIPCSRIAFDFCRIGARRIILGSLFVIGIGSLICGSPLKFGDRLLGKAMTTTVPYVAMGSVPVIRPNVCRREADQIQDCNAVLLAVGQLSAS